MFNFSESSVSEAVKKQLDAQFSFFAQFSDKMLDGVQKMNALNAHLAKTLFDESVASAQQLLSPSDQAAKPQMQSPEAVAKFREYQQGMQNIITETQAGIAKIVETHVPETTRAAEAVVREVTQRASEDAVKATQRQKEAFEKMAAQSSQAAERAAQAAAERATQAAAASKPMH